jgi:8-oxo-dGTP pyrophosphatase MutT (NUDIX family)
MKAPEKEQINEIRKTGFKPGVVCCFVNDRKLLFLFSKEYNIWMLPQGGIDNNETPEAAIYREMAEELGEKFVKNISEIKELVHADELEFSNNKRFDKFLKTDEGEELRMLGKFYFFFVIETKNQLSDISSTEFDQVFWVNYTQAKYLTSKMYIPNKAEIISKVLDIIRKKGYIE